MNNHLQSGKHPDADQISAFVDHALPAHEREKMLAHLAECADCRETVVLSLPAMEDSPAAPAEKKSGWWTWGATLLWPAAAATLTVVLLYVHHVTNSHKGSGGPGPEIALQQRADRGKQEYAAPSAGGIGSSEDQRKAGTTPQAGAAVPKKDDATQGNRLAADTNRRTIEFHLPSGVMAISAVTRGQQVLAIDYRNQVFLSNDGGASWIAVQVPWKGRAVKAKLVSYRAPATLREKTAASGGAALTGANVSAAGEAQNSSDAARFTEQKNLRQEPKEGYRAPMSSSGAAAAAPPTAPSPALTAPVPSALVGSHGDLTGIITDRTGAVIPGASVTITSPTNHSSWKAVTGADGRYRIEGLATGTYQLEAQSPGFKATTLSAIQIAASSSNTTNITLDIGASSQTVMVQADTPEIATASPEPGGNVISLEQKSASSIASVRSTPVFEITTDTGDHWTSADGVNWHRQ